MGMADAVWILTRVILLRLAVFKGFLGGRPDFLFVTVIAGHGFEGVVGLWDGAGQDGGSLQVGVGLLFGLEEHVVSAVLRVAYLLKRILAV